MHIYRPIVKILLRFHYKTFWLILFLVKMFMIVDEAHNLTPHGVKTIITRAGEGTKSVPATAIRSTPPLLWAFAQTASAP